jgi:hypothetical protein
MGKGNFEVLGLLLAVIVFCLLNSWGINKCDHIYVEVAKDSVYANSFNVYYAGADLICVKCLNKAKQTVIQNSPVWQNGSTQLPANWFPISAIDTGSDILFFDSVTSTSPTYPSVKKVIKSNKPIKNGKQQIRSRVSN